MLQSSSYTLVPTTLLVVDRRHGDDVVIVLEGSEASSRSSSLR